MMLCRKSANVRLKSGDTETFLIPFAQEIFLPGLPAQSRNMLKKCKIMEDFTEYQTHSSEIRNGFWGPCGPPKIECKLWAEVSVAKKSIKSFLRDVCDAWKLRTTWVETWLGFTDSYDSGWSYQCGLGPSFPKQQSSASCHLPPVNISNGWAWGCNETEWEISKWLLERNRITWESMALPQQT